MLKNHVFQTFETAILHVFEIFTSEKKTFGINIFCDEYLKRKKDSPKKEVIGLSFRYFILKKVTP